MKMKIYKFGFFILGLIIIATSCNKDKFTTRLPQDRITEDNFWLTENDLKLYNNALYPMYIDGLGSSWAAGTIQPWGVNEVKMVYGDAITDNFAPESYARVPAGQYNAPTSSGSGGWNFSNIRQLNIFLDNYNKANASQAVKNLYLSEVYFFKAWDYFEKVKLFGDVPWLNTELNTNSPELYAPRTPRAQVMDSVISLLDFAIQWLPAKGGEQSGRINKDAALHLKARIGLHEGTFRKYHGLTDGAKFLNYAVSACEQLMSDSRYSIYTISGVSDPYNKMFAQYSYASNREIILWRQYDAEQSYGSAFSRYYTQNLRHRWGATRNLVDEYLCTDGLPISQSPLFNPANRGLITKEFENRDPRLRQTIALYGEYANAVGIMGSSNAPKPNLPGTSGNKCPTGYRLAKWFINDPADWGRVTNGMQAGPVFRYAETLLIYAEAKEELGQSTQTVINNTINAIRARVGMPALNITNIPADPELDAAYSTYCSYVPSPLLREIRRERRIEMVAEDTRWDDLMRWKAARFLEIPVLGMKFVQSEYPNLTPGQGIYLNSNGFIEPYQRTLPGTRVWDNKQYYFPIPLEDLILNTNLEQNSGWPTK
ncbi:MAG: RagB/SusD family nutrient uptake outer membrane protein [Niabella sp.]